MVDRLGQQLGELLVVEDLEAAAAGDLAHSGGVEAVVVVAVAALDEDAAVAEALGVNLPSHVVQMDACRGERESRAEVRFVKGNSDNYLSLCSWLVHNQQG